MTSAAMPVPSATRLIVDAIKALYGIQTTVEKFLDRHIEDMKGSSNTTVSRSGEILERAKYGFGIGYVVPISVIAVGQLLLGNPLSAVTTVATTMMMTNPVAMTCAAIGAIYYGWSALSDKERQDILEKISNGLEIGVALVKAIVEFVISTTNALISSKSIKEFKDFIKSAANVFGKRLSDVTGKFSDLTSDTIDVISKTVGKAAERTGDALVDVYETGTSGAKTAVAKMRGKKAAGAPSVSAPEDVAVNAPKKRVRQTSKAVTEKTPTSVKRVATKVTRQKVTKRALSKKVRPT